MCFHTALGIRMNNLRYENMKYIMYLFMVFLLVGCAGKPSDGEVKKQIIASILSDGGEKTFNVENYEKINGYEKDSNTYVADVKYDLVFKKGMKEIAQELKQQAKGSPFGAGLGVMVLQMQFGNFEAGHRVTNDEEITFIKTEKGWRIRL